MPLQFRDVWVPLAAGMDQSVDDRVAPISKLQKADNVEFTKAGALQKRHGFRPLGATVDDGTALSDVRGIFSTGRELCIVDDRNLYAYDDDNHTWHDRGFVSPLVGRTDVLFRDSFDWRYVDLHSDLGANYIMAVGQRSEMTTNAGTDTRVDRCQVAIYDADDLGCIHEPQQSPTNLYNPKVGRCYQKTIAIGSTGTSTGAAEELDVIEWNTTTPNTAPVAAAFNPTIVNLHYSWQYRTCDLDREPENREGVYGLVEFDD